MPENSSPSAASGSRPCPTCGGSGIAPDNISEIMDAAGQVGSDHPVTSHKAATIPLPRFGTQRHHALRALAHYGPSTAAEVAHRIGVSRNQTATRLGELRKGGLVAYLRDPESGERIERETGPSGDTGLVQIITEEGRRVLLQLAEQEHHD